MIATPAHMSLAGRSLLGVGLVGLGVIGLIFADVPRQWPPPPVFASIRTALGVGTAILLVFAGAGLQFARTRRLAAYAGVTAFLAWAVFLHVPRLLPHAWNAFAECVALAVGCWLFHPRAAQRFDVSVRYPLGACLLSFGTAHFVYADFTIAFAPAWIPPGPAFWVYATGAGVIAAGISFLLNVIPHIAAVCLGITYTSFVLFVHIPRVAADIDSRIEWTVLFVSVALTGMAWSVASALAARRPVFGRVGLSAS